MISTYLKTGWRNLTRNKIYSLINVLGLSLGLTSSLLIALWVADEYGVDAFHDDIDRLYVVTSKEISGGEITYGGHDTPGLLGEELARVMPEVEYSCSYAWAAWRTFATNGEPVKLPGQFAGKDFFRMFSYKLIIGSPETALPSIESIAISRRMAGIFFGSPEAAIDQSIKLDNYRELKITAVFEDVGSNSSEQFEYVLSWDLFMLNEPWLKNWHNSGPTTFLKLRNNTDAPAVASKIREFIKGYDKEYSEIDRLELGLQPYGEKYLYSNFKNGEVSGGRIEYVRLFNIVAAFILLIACINFMNTSTARSIKRAKEIGVRKVMGAVKGALASQFMLEAFVFTTIAVLFSVILLMLLLPGFNLVVGKNIAAPIFDPEFWIGLLALTLITGAISGSYPALLLSSFKPIAALKSNFKVTSSSISFRRILVVVQFALSMIFIVGTIVVSKQVEFIHNKNIGYDKYNLLYIQLTGELGKNFETFKHELMQTPTITEVTRVTNRPIELENTTGDILWEGKAPGSKPVFTVMAVGYNFTRTMNIGLAAGRDFSEVHADSSNYLINESALKIIGYKDPIGMPLTMWGVKGAIVGVLKDFHFNSLHVPIAPLIIRLRPNIRYGYAVIRTQPGKTPEALEAIERIHKKLNPDFPFAHQFADEEYAASYQSEMVARKLSQYFAFLSIFISCIGLLGLAIFMAEQRIKEMGIRKVLGANILNIVTLLSRDFVKLISLAILVAVPVSWYVMDGWLHGFQYNVGIHWWMFAVAAGTTVFIAVLILAVQAVKSATANPIDSLKVE